MEYSPWEINKDVFFPLMNAEVHYCLKMIHPVPWKLYGGSEVAAFPLFIYLFIYFLQHISAIKGGHQGNQRITQGIFLSFDINHTYINFHIYGI